MAAETSFKLKADIGPFKTAMTEAKAATKTLDAELKLAQAQFKVTGDAEQYLDTRSKVLAQQMTQQQKAADAARRRVILIKLVAADGVALYADAEHFALDRVNDAGFVGFNDHGEGNDGKAVQFE